MCIRDRFPKSSIHCSSTLGGVLKTGLYSSQTKTRVTDVFPLLVRDAIMSTRLASNYSTYWPIYGLKSNCIDSTIDRPNPYAITPPQVIRTTPISPTTARQHQLHQDVLPLLMRSRGYSLCCDFQCIHGYVARRWNVTLLSGTRSYTKAVYYPRFF